MSSMRLPSAPSKAPLSPRPIDMGRVDAQQARRVLDRLVGYKISPLLWAKVKKGLSAGRVQSVATRMVVMREQDIEAFIPEEYWDVTVKAQAHGGRGRKTHFTAKLVTLDGAKANITNGADAQKAVERIQKAHFAVYTIKRGEKRKFPAAPFTTSSLQQEASRKLGFTTAKTMPGGASSSTRASTWREKAPRVSFPTSVRTPFVSARKP